MNGKSFNRESAKSYAENFYGKITHPQIKEVVQLILRFYREAKLINPKVTWSDIRLWRMVLKGAYTLLSFRLEEVGLFGVEVTGEYVFLQLCGIFGWTCMPAAFLVVSRALVYELNQLLISFVAIYVDDICGVCLAWDLLSDLSLSRKVIFDLLGPDSVADEKTEYGVRLDFIGYTVDIQNRTISIARKIFLRTFHGFTTVDIDGQISLHVAQRLAS